MVAINLLDRQSISANHGSETELTDHRLNAGSVSRMRVSCALVTNVESPEVIVEAERLGNRRAWLYDSPALTSDVWVALALAAERTSTVGLGPGVLVPNLRHPMTNAAAIATIAAMAPGRAAIAVGSGFTARYTLGQRPLRWTTVEEYVVALRALLRGETVQWEGASIRMLQTDGFVADRPVDVEVLERTGPKEQPSPNGSATGCSRQEFPMWPRRADNTPSSSTGPSSTTEKMCAGRASSRYPRGSLGAAHGGG
jgi:Luciferase-like monooxygenase